MAPAPSSRRPTVVSATVVWFAAALVWASLAVAVYWVAVRTSWGQHLDGHLLNEWAAQNRPVRGLAVLLRSVLPFVLCILVFRLCVVAWWVRRRLVAVVAVVLVVTVVVAMALRDALLPRPDLGVGGPNTLPSNHMAFTVALVGAVLFLRWAGARWAGWPTVRPRPDWRVAAVLVVAVAAEAAVNVVTYAHRPADPLAALAMVAALWSAAVAVYGDPRRGVPDQVVPSHLPEDPG
ncbi:MAG: hypothetical protein FWD11_06855 [Micrococcales bacterium]|nr:hypothetical protein [Micrococcales bacterium]